MFDVRIKTLAELPDFSKMRVKDNGLPENWGFCRGGEGLEHDQWAIQHVLPDLTADRYPLPRFVSTLVRWERNNEREDIQRSLRSLLGLDG